MLCTSPVLSVPHALLDAHHQKRTEENLARNGEVEIPFSSIGRTRRSCTVGMLSSIPLISLCSGCSLASQLDIEYPPKTELIQSRASFPSPHAIHAWTHLYTYVHNCALCRKICTQLRIMYSSVHKCALCIDMCMDVSIYV